VVSLPFELFESSQGGTLPHLSNGSFFAHLPYL
jgi:hypothetical protein